MSTRHLLLPLAVMCLSCVAPDTSEKAYFSQSTSEYFKLIPVYYRQKGISTIRNPEDLRQFFAVWKTKQKVHPTSGLKFEYSFDIRCGNEGGRWLYDSAGFVQKLNIFRKPIYRIESFKEFNQTLGIKEEFPLASDPTMR